MKKLSLVTLMLLIPTLAIAWTIAWDYSDNADGYVLYWGEVGGVFKDIDVGNVNSHDLDSLGLNKGTRYEFYLQAYTGDPKSFSGESDHPRWTMPHDPKIIELPEEQRVIINIY